MAEGVGGRFLGGAGGGDHYFLAEAGPVGVDGSAGSVSSFSQLLFGNDDEVALGIDVGHQIGQQQHTSSTAAYAFPNYQAACIGDKPPEMLCFGGDCNQQHGSASTMFIAQEATKCAPQKLSSGVTCSDSSSASSGNNNYNTSSNGANANANININNNNNNNNNNLLHASINGSATTKSNKKRNAPIIKKESTSGLQCTSPAAVTPEAGERTGKKTRTRNPSTHLKGQRVKLGDRIAALQQLVSPYGKTDTASVLHEAIGYVKFLHDQVQVLCSPYLQSLPDGLGNGGEAGGGASRRSLRSRGLCLVPVDFTAHVANANGADYWSSANLGHECNQYPGNSV